MELLEETDSYISFFAPLLNVLAGDTKGLASALSLSLSLSRA